MDRIANKRIIVLDAATANKIAAGEVVERPASVVKELLENSIDAGSRRIVVEIEGGGQSLIRVTDDGTGISGSDVELAFRRHATSKITTADDLFALTTLGFRGEALPSIAAVSRLEMRTRTPDSVTGTAISLEGGIVQKSGETGCPRGTSITVRDLFYNTPARREFLKTPPTESAHVSDVVTRLALAHPEISFRFLNSRQLVFHSPGNGSEIDVISAVYGKEIARRMQPVDYRADNVAITGFVSPPAVNRANRSAFSLFVNRRYVQSKTGSDAVLEAYHTMLPLHRFPVVVLNITVPPGAVDVNIHPSKMEVRFHDAAGIYRHILAAVRGALASASLIPAAPHLVRKGSQALISQTSFRSYDRSFTGQSGQISSQLPDVNPGAAAKEPETAAVLPAAVCEPGINYAPLPASCKTHPGFPELAVIGQVHNTYIVAQGDDGVYIIDQHAAQERINYEKMMRDASGRSASQTLLVPVVLNLTLQEKTILREYLPVFERLGFGLEPFGGNSYLLRAVPGIFTASQGEGIIQAILAELLSRGRTPQSNEIREEAIVQAACKAAVKANERLSRGEAESLLQQLAATANPYTCPHGRPTLISFTLTDLEKQFKRI